MKPPQKKTDSDIQGFGLPEQKHRADGYNSAIYDYRKYIKEAPIEDVVYNNIIEFEPPDVKKVAEAIRILLLEGEK